MGWGWVNRPLVVKTSDHGRCWYYQGNVISLSPYTEQSGVCVKNEVEQESNLGNTFEERKTSEETLRF